LPPVPEAAILPRVTDPAALTLRSGPLGLTLLPRAGGAIARFWSEATGAAIDLLRPASAAARAAGDPWGMASFPLVPWSNRIRRGRFTFGARAVALTPTWPHGGHAIHGLGFRAAWALVDRGSARVALEHRHAPGEWPWAYRARQDVELSPEGLRLALAVTNESDAPMPLGLGWHPYVARTRETTLTAEVGGLWLTDAEVLPTALVAPPPGRDPRQGLAVDRVALDNVFTGWDGRAVVRWPERRLRLTIRATPVLGCLVVYTPPGERFFCLEPVSQVTDAFNLLAAGRPDTGTLVVPPGRTQEAAVTLVPQVE
jgi:aldose 1-epimerase